MIRFILKKMVLIIGVILCLTNNIAMAGKALSWNFKLSFIGKIPKNPNDVWTYMQNTPSNNDPSKFTLLPTYQANCDLSRWNIPRDPNFNCWQDLKSHAMIGAVSSGQPYPYMHPGINNQIVIRWSSPMSGKISVMGIINDDNASCGDGIKWFVRTQSNNLLGGILKGQGYSFLIRVLPVKKGNHLYFIVDKNKDNYCDGTSMDILITSQQ